MQYLTFARENDLYSHLKYFIYADDDEYFRPDQVMRWLATIENSGIN